MVTVAAVVGVRGDGGGLDFGERGLFAVRRLRGRADDGVAGRLTPRAGDSAAACCAGDSTARGGATDASSGTRSVGSVEAWARWALVQARGIDLCEHGVPVP